MRLSPMMLATVAMACLALLAPSVSAFVPGARSVSAAGLRFVEVAPSDEGGPSRRGVVTMAVPKKRTSKMKTRSRFATWMRKSDKQAERAMSLAKSVLSGKQTSFIYNTEQSSDADEAEDAEQ
mmetsp:Transcript_5930/g.17322  ORF Transcript_5930/g.17322 Transcript_5930/m.17322 type:complete len:123 (-) Transcript_5930:568-936(-)|eukprot:CAMPEP_0118977272 /NCGR_PEP_ID=MMETSP1173-20130426/20959_1 /TAXON_ID=1034831 /ORGANISM="Rhizochromulina marina cf, Strain CCMP1243" /LENGTH=122 /DNA_ID=CAMNT_0006927357 /DNA_START=106 /DNA_END=474 /DNA_ORIENTATION=+